MKVKIDYDIFQCAVTESQRQALSFLLNILIYKQRYELVITDEGVLTTLSYSKMSEADKSIIRQSLLYSITANIIDVDCIVNTQGEVENENPVFSLEEAIRYLLQPLSIIVENSLNDSHFLLAIFRTFDNTGKLLEGYKNGWLQFENAGGCMNVLNFLEARRQFFGGKLKFLHCYVLLDGDKRFPTDKITKNNKLITQMEKWHIPYHVLEKRCMENYLPEDVMERVLGNKNNIEWIHAYRSLTPEQKDYFCISGGFQKELTKEKLQKVKNEKRGRAYKRAVRKFSVVKKYLPSELKHFYQDVMEGNFLHLEQGLMLNGSFKDTYPLAFTNEIFVYRKALEERTKHQHNPNELRDMKDEIKRML